MPKYAPIASKFSIFFNLRDQIPGLAKISEVLFGFTAKRKLPKWRQDFFKDSELPNSVDANDTKIPVILFVDTFNRYYEPENVRSAINVLRAAGYFPFIPVSQNSSNPLCCGRTYLSNGLVDQARFEIEKILTTFEPYLKKGISVVGLEPSCILSFRDELPSLIQSQSSDLLKENSFTFEELLVKNIKNVKFKSLNEKILIHGHCHQKAFDVVKPIEQILNKVPELTFETINTSCCGMAGAFGYDKDTYDISMKMANDKLFPAIKKYKANVKVIADGTSCRCQIKDGLNIQAIHLAKFLDNNII